MGAPGVSRVTGEVSKMLKKILSLVLPRWAVEDAINRLTHPYWLRKDVPLDSAFESGRRVEVGGQVGQGGQGAQAGTGRGEKTSSRRPFKRVNRARVLEELGRSNAKRILDVGCGTGALMRELTPLGFEVSGVTVNPEEVELTADERAMLCDIQSGLSKGPLNGKTFDAVLSFDCIEHMEAPLSALRNINRLLKDNGLFIAYIPPSRWTECDYHTIVYTPRQFRWLLNLTGFELEARQGRHFFSKKGTTYYARKRYSDRMVYPGVME